MNSCSRVFLELVSFDLPEAIWPLTFKSVASSNCVRHTVGRKKLRGAKNLCNKSGNYYCKWNEGCGEQRSIFFCFRYWLFESYVFYFFFCRITFHHFCDPISLLISRVYKPLTRTRQSPSPSKTPIQGILKGGNPRQGRCDWQEGEREEEGTCIRGVNMRDECYARGVSCLSFIYWNLNPRMNNFVIKFEEQFNIEIQTIFNSQCAFLFLGNMTILQGAI